jgi:hypothetical protein
MGAPRGGVKLGSLWSKPITEEERWLTVNRICWDGSPT